MTRTSSNRIPSVFPSTPSTALYINVLWVEGDEFPSTFLPPSFHLFYGTTLYILHNFVFIRLAPKATSIFPIPLALFPLNAAGYFF